MKKRQIENQEIEENSKFDYALTQSPLIDFHEKSKCFRIRMRYRISVKRKFSEIVESYGYHNEEDAKLESIAFRNSYEFNGGKNWIHYNQRSSLIDLEDYKIPSLTKARANTYSPMNIAESKAFNHLKSLSKSCNIHSENITKKEDFLRHIRGQDWGDIHKRLMRDVNKYYRSVDVKLERAQIKI